MGAGSYLKRAARFIVRGIPDYHVQVTVSETAASSRLKGKNVIVTGGSRGLGYAIAKRCISEGASVVITGRNPETLKKAENQLGSACHGIVHDAADIAGIPAFLQKAAAAFNGEKIHCLVSNAGISLHEGNFRNVTEDGWDRQLDTNLKGNYFLVKYFIEYLEQQQDKSGNVLVVTSERSMRSDDLPYGLTKSASNSFIRCFASKVIEEGIRVNGIAPGVTASDMTGVDRNGNLYADWQPSNRYFLPEEVAEVALFLLSDVSNCISGEIIACDQGRYIAHW